MTHAVELLLLHYTSTHCDTTTTYYAFTASMYQTYRLLYVKFSFLNIRGYDDRMDSDPNRQKKSERNTVFIYLF